jgi:hypothetical protein
VVGVRSSTRAPAGGRLESVTDEAGGPRGTEGSSEGAMMKAAMMRIPTRITGIHATKPLFFRR